MQADRSQTLAAMLQSAAIRFSRAEVEAITDGLTGLYNHRYLHERLEEELERARRRGSTLSLLFCDCDHFKSYNDAYGHKAGDARPLRASRASSRPTAGAPIWRRATAVRSSCSPSSTRTPTEPTPWPRPSAPRSKPSARATVAP